jgi:hypothetical protein
VVRSPVATDFESVSSVQSVVKAPDSDLIRG